MYKNLYFKQPKATDKIPKDKYLVQRKYDGERMFFIDKGIKGVLLNRRGVIKNKQFPEFNNLAKQIPGKSIIDAEMVVFKKTNVESFNLLSQRTHLKYGISEKEKQYPATLMAFDVLKYNNKDLRQQPLSQRLRVLKRLPTNVRLQHIKSYPVSQARQLLQPRYVEGVIFKDPQSSYSDAKDDAWLKYKKVHEADLAITGYEKGKGKREGMVGAVYLGVWDGRDIRSVGKAGSFKGYSEQDLSDLRQRLNKYKTDEHNGNVNVKPKIFAKVQFIEKGAQGALRMPVVIGTRTDIGIKDTHLSMPIQDKSKDKRSEDVKKLAYHIKNILTPYSTKIEIAGSIRREKENPKDIDIVLVPKNKEAIIEKMKSLGARMRAEGDTLHYSTINGIHVDLFFATKDEFGAQMMTRTGPNVGNIGNRALAKRKGLLLNQYGLFKGKHRIAGRTEKGIYEALGKHYKEPKYRGLSEREVEKIKETEDKDRLVGRGYENIDDIKYMEV